MKHVRKTAGALLVALMLAGSAIAGETSSQITTTSQYRAGSTEAQQVQVWLNKYTERFNGQVVGEPNKLGDVTITHSRPGTVQRSVNDPPVPLPATGSPGETISITSNANGLSQSWTYQWQGNSVSGGWKLIKYSMERTTNTGPES